MADAKFSIKEALSYGWTAFKGHLGFFLGFMVAMALLSIIPDVVANRVFPQGTALFIPGRLIVWLISMALGLVATRISLNIYDKGEPDAAGALSVAPLYPRYIAGKFLYFVIVAVGLLLLIVPGLIVAYMFLYTGYLIVDRQMGPIAALQESRVVTDGSKMSLFLFSLAVAGVNILGALCLFIGLFVTIPVTLMASVYVYRQLSPAVSA